MIKGKINLKPTWKGALHIYLLAFENGTPQGRKEAIKGLKEMAQALDDINLATAVESDDLADMLTQWKKDNKCGSDAFSELTGLDVNSLAKFEDKKNVPHYDWLTKFVKAMGLEFRLVKTGEAVKPEPQNK